jgi:putative ABC transport system substrate-binding protein
MAAQVAGSLLGIHALLGLVATPMRALAQTALRLPRIGMLFFGVAPTASSPDSEKGFLKGLRDLGYVEGQNVRIERRYAQGRSDRLASLAAELVQLPVDVIVAAGPGPLGAARSATRTIPIVTVSGADPVRDGWASSLARPGGNVTGLTVTFPELHLKRLEVMKQAFPQIVRVVMLAHPAEAASGVAYARLTDADARRLGLLVTIVEIHGPGDFDAAFALARTQRAQAIYAVATNTVLSHAAKLAALAAADRLVSISEFALLAQAGFVLTYGADLDDVQRRSITQVHKIPNGARPGELPIERPTKFRLALNLASAKAIGLAVPQSLLLRADEVIE